MPELVEFATTVMTMLSGDIIACGTNHEGLGALQDSETVQIEIQGIGKMALEVVDPLKRTWSAASIWARFNPPRGSQATSSPRRRCLRRTKNQELPMKADDLNLKPQYRMPRVLGPYRGRATFPKTSKICRTIKPSS